MKQTILAAIALLCILTVANSATTLIAVYDPTAGTKVAVALTGGLTPATGNHLDYLKYFRVQIFSSNTIFQMVTYGSFAASTSAFTTKTFAKPTSQAWTVQALSNDLTCFVGKKSTTNAFFANIGAVTPAVNTFYDLIAVGGGNIAQANIVPSKLLVGTNCLAYIKDKTVTDLTAAGFDIMRSTDGVSYYKDTFDTINPWSAATAGDIAFNDDLTVAVADNGIYKLTPVTGAASTWARAVAGAFGVIRKVWTLGNKIIVAHMPAGASPIITVQFFYDRGFLVQASSKITTAAVMGTPTIANPRSFIAISQSFTKVAVYGSLNAAGNAPFYLGKSIDWTTAIPVAMDLVWTGSSIFAETFATSAALQMSVSDSFWYVRTGAKYVAGYWNGVNVIQSVSQSITTAEWKVANFKRSVLTPYKTNQINVIHEVDTSGKIQLYQSIISISSTYILPTELDRTTSQNAAYTATGALTLTTTSWTQSFGKFNWFYTGVKAYNATKTVYGLWYFDSFLNKINTDLELTSPPAASLVKSSYSGFCAIIKDTAVTLKVYNFQLPFSGTVSFPFAVISENIAETAFDISDDCKAYRAGAKVYHWDSSVSPAVYVLDTTIAAMTATTPIFSADFSVAVNEAGIWAYTPKSGATAGSYALNRAETYLAASRSYTILVGNYLVIIRAKLNIGTTWDYKIQANYYVNSTSWLKVTGAQDSGTSGNLPGFSVSQNNGKWAVWGRTTSNSAFQTIRSIDYVGNATKTFTFPDTVKALNLDIAVSESFIYARSLDAGTPKHYGYVFSGATLAQSFNTAFTVLPSSWTGCKRSLFVPDFTGKLTLISQFDNTWTIGAITTVYASLFSKFQGKTAGQITVPKTMVYDFSLDYSASTTTQVYSSSLSVINVYQNVRYNFWGRWIYMTTTDTKIGASIYVQNGATVAARKVEVVLGTALSAAATIKAISYGGDCVVSVISTTNVFVHSISESGVTLVQDMAVATVVAFAVDVPAPLTASWSASTGCNVVKANAFVYVKGTGTPKFVKAPLASAYTNLIFDPTFKFVLDVVVPATPVIKALSLYTPDYVGTAVINANAGALEANTRIWVSGDSKTILLLTWSAGFAFKLRYFNLISSAWAPAVSDATNLILSGTSTGSAPRVVYTPKMEIVAITYTSYSSLPTIKIFKLTITSIKFTEILPPPIDFNPGASQYLYFDETSGTTYLQLISISSGLSQEVIYSINKAAATPTLTQVSRCRLSFFDFQRGAGYLFESFKFIATDANTWNAYYQYDDVTNKKAYIRKTIVHNSTSIALLSTITVREVGLAIFNNIPMPCPTGCISCTDPTACLGCSDGWVLDYLSNVCFKCDTNCKVCLSASYLTMCAGCYDGYYLSQNKCLRCSDNCATCYYIGQWQICLTCKINFYLTNIPPIFSCSPCMDNCNICSSAAVCLQCSRGYVYQPILKKCMKCTLGCSLCKPQDVTICLGCYVGYRSATVSATNLTIVECVPCPLNCNTCNSTACFSCQNGYRLSNQGKCIQLCKFPCWTCSEINPISCTACVKGYVLNNSSCLADASCSTESTCITCPVGYNLIQSKCVKCNVEQQHCLSCLHTDVTVCGVCAVGYYLGIGNKCYKCAAGCDDCSQGIFCNKCSSGYTLVRNNILQNLYNVYNNPAPLPIIQYPSNCIKCRQNCGTCYISPQNCLTCSVGYVKVGWNCLSINRMVVRLKFVDSFNSFGRIQNIEKILQKFAYGLNADVSRVDAVSLKVEGLTGSAMQGQQVPSEAPTLQSQSPQSMHQSLPSPSAPQLSIPSSSPPVSSLMNLELTINYYSLTQLNSLQVALSKIIKQNNLQYSIHSHQLEVFNANVRDMNHPPDNNEKVIQQSIIMLQVGIAIVASSIIVLIVIIVLVGCRIVSIRHFRYSHRGQQIQQREQDNSQGQEEQEEQQEQQGQSEQQGQQGHR